MKNFIIRIEDLINDKELINYFGINSCQINYLINSDDKNFFSNSFENVKTERIEMLNCINYYLNKIDEDIKKENDE